MRSILPLVVLASFTLISTGGASAQSNGALSIYVDPFNGSDGADGLTPTTAFQTLQAAQAWTARANRADRDVIVNLRGGAYRLDRTLTFGPDHGGRGLGRVTYRAITSEERPVLSGGIDVTGTWRDPDGDGVFETQLPPGTRSRNLFIAGRHATLARGPSPLSSVVVTETGLVADDSPLPDFAHPATVELAWYGSWKWKVFSPESIERIDGRTVITMKQPGWSLRGIGRDSIDNPGYPGAFPQQNPMLIQNARELLDEPGEWFLDPITFILAYKPAEHVDINVAESVLAIVPDRLVAVEGTPSESVRNLSFEGLTFSHATFLAPSSEMGYTGNQSDTIRSEPGTSIVTPAPATVTVRYGDGIHFSRSRFQNSGTAGLFFDEGTHGSGVIGSIFTDLGSHGVRVGTTRRELVDIDSCLGCETFTGARITRDIAVENNYIHDIGFESPSGAQGIHTAWAQGVRIRHNDLHDLGYSGIGVGYRWTDTPGPQGAVTVSFNRVYDILKFGRDGAGIYTVGNLGGGGMTTVANNQVFMLQNDYAAYYPDEGSSDSIWEDNLAENLGSRLWLHNHSIGKIMSQSNLVFRNNFSDYPDAHYWGLRDLRQVEFFLPGVRPPAAQAIAERAGVEPEHQTLLDYRPVVQAENMAATGPVERTRPGFNGSGYRTLDSRSALQATFDAGLGGAVSLRLRYQAETAAEAVILSGEDRFPVSLPPSADWGMAAVPVTLPRGAASIRLHGLDVAVAIDEIELAGAILPDGPADLIPVAGALTRRSTLDASAAWTDLDRVVDGSAASGPAVSREDEAAISFTLAKRYNRLTFMLQPESGVRSWRIQVGTQDGGWTNASPWIPNQGGEQQVYEVKTMYGSDRLRVVLQGADQPIRIAELRAFGTDADAPVLETGSATPTPAPPLSALP